MKTPALAALALMSLVSLVHAQDTEFIRALEAAQRGRPAELAPTARIAPESEPGTPLVIHGRAFAEDGRTPLAASVVFAYQTDRTGVYNSPGSPPHSWRLKGWAKTDADGRFEFRTIRPGSYPGTKNPAHVHFTVFTASGSRFHAGELQFADDPVLDEREREASARDAQFGSVRPVRREGKVEHVDLNLRENARQRF